MANILFFILLLDFYLKHRRLSTNIRANLYLKFIILPIFNVFKSNLVFLYSTHSKIYPSS